MPLCKSKARLNFCKGKCDFLGKKMKQCKILTGMDWLQVVYDVCICI